MIYRPDNNIVIRFSGTPLRLRALQTTVDTTECLVENDEEQLKLWSELHIVQQNDPQSVDMVGAEGS